MSRKDYFTGKKAMSGNKKSHAMNHSRRQWNVNLQTVRITLPNGQVKKVKVSAKTLKTLNKRKINGASKGVKKPVAKKAASKKPAAKKETKAATK